MSFFTTPGSTNLPWSSFLHQIVQSPHVLVIIPDSKNTLWSGLLHQTVKILNFLVCYTRQHEASMFWVITLDSTTPLFSYVLHQMMMMMADSSQTYNVLVLQQTVLSLHVKYRRRYKKFPCSCLLHSINTT